MLLEVGHGRVPAGETIADRCHLHARNAGTHPPPYIDITSSLPSQQERHHVHFSVGEKKRKTQTDQAAPKDHPPLNPKPAPWFRLDSPKSSSRLLCPVSRRWLRCVARLCSCQGLRGLHAGGDPAWRGMAGLRALEIPPGRVASLSFRHLHTDGMARGDSWPPPRSHRR